MSHFTTIQTQVRDLAALADACAELGLSLHQNAKCRGYANITRQAPHVIKLKGPYDNPFRAGWFPPGFNRVFQSLVGSTFSFRLVVLVHERHPRLSGLRLAPRKLLFKVGAHEGLKCGSKTGRKGVVLVTL